MHRSSELAARAAEQLSAIIDLMEETPGRGAEAAARVPEAVATLRAFSETYEAVATPRLAELARDAFRIATQLEGHDLIAVCVVCDEDGQSPSDRELRAAHQFCLDLRAELQANAS